MYQPQWLHSDLELQAVVAEHLVSLLLVVTLAGGLVVGHVDH